jgi:putative redox protein
VISILKKKRQQVTDYRIEVSGERRDEFPKRFTKLTVKHIVRGHQVHRAGRSQGYRTLRNKVLQRRRNSKWRGNCDEL